MQLLKNLRYAISTCLLSIAGLLVFLGGHPFAQVRAANEPAHQLDLPTTVHGFAKAPGLPEGDLFLLPEALQLAIHSPNSSPELFTVNADTFGDVPQAMGALANVPAQGFSAAQANETVSALTRADHVSQINFLLAGTEATIGDTVRVFARNTATNAAGATELELARFTAQADGFHLTEINGAAKLYLDNRFALGPDTPQGAVLPFVDFAGPRGRRTGLVSLLLADDAAPQLKGQVQLGFEIKRAEGFGIASLVLTDLVVKRARVAGDENNPGTGLLGQTSGGYPSGTPCTGRCQ